jgi:hypothetical protein
MKSPSDRRKRYPGASNSNRPRQLLVLVGLLTVVVSSAGLAAASHTVPTGNADYASLTIEQCSGQPFSLVFQGFFQATFYGAFVAIGLMWMGTYALERSESGDSNYHTFRIRGLKFLVGIMLFGTVLYVGLDVVGYDVACLNASPPGL